MPTNTKQADIFEALKLKVYQALSEEVIDPETGESSSIHPRDLAALGNLVLRLQERDDRQQEDLKQKSGTLNNVVSFPALPAQVTL